jgi:ABC-type phosphate/phosphonate transport system substrate-binding protein
MDGWMVRPYTTGTEGNRAIQQVLIKMAKEKDKMRKEQSIQEISKAMELRYNEKMNTVRENVRL